MVYFSPNTLYTYSTISQIIDLSTRLFFFKFFKNFLNSIAYIYLKFFDYSKIFQNYFIFHIFFSNFPKIYSHSAVQQSFQNYPKIMSFFLPLPKIFNFFSFHEFHYNTSQNTAKWFNNFSISSRYFYVISQFFQNFWEVSSLFSSAFRKTFPKINLQFFRNIFELLKKIFRSFHWNGSEPLRNDSKIS